VGEILIFDDSFLILTNNPNFNVNPSANKTDDKEPGLLYFYKSRSAPEPYLILQVQRCVCNLTECVGCYLDWYCFVIRTHKYGHESKSVELTVCAKNSKQAEAWMFALQDGGAKFKKVDEGAITAKSLFELSGNDLLTNEIVPLSKFQGKVCLVVNVSSKCGLTPKQYPELMQLYKTYKDRGFEVLGFPSNDFNNQEPGTPEEIRKFVDDNYGIEFPMFAKIHVNGTDTHDVFKFLKQSLGGVLGSSIKWNFTKFLVNRDGVPVKRYMPTTQPITLVPDIEELLG